MNFGCIATGILQLLSLKCSQMIWKSYRGWPRTTTSEVPSEETVMIVIQQSFFHNFHFRNARIYAIIMAKKRKSFPERSRDVV